MANEQYRDLVARTSAKPGKGLPVEHGVVNTDDDWQDNEAEAVQQDRGAPNGDELKPTESGNR